jgi:predicted phage terminase large subunit-like protein
MNLADVDIAQMTRAQKLALSALLDEKLKRTKNANAQDDLIDFAHAVYPNYSVGGHHRIMAKLFKDIVDGKKKRVIVAVPPRHGKSELTSYLFPAWFLGQKPDAKIIMATHTANLSEDFGKRVRNLIDSAEYREIFPKTLLAEDSKSAGSWNTTSGGKYFAAGVGGALAGRGADLVVIDDAHSEQDGKSNSKTVFEQAWSWYQTGPRQRLMWGGAIVVVGTRWSLLDLTGRLLDYQRNNPGADQWEMVELPAIMPSGRALWPEKWPIKELLQTKATLEPRYWNAQYQQQPASDESAIIKREWWREWPHEDPPDVNFVIQTWDTAHEAKSSSDYSACTTWGIFDEVIQEGPEAGKVKPGIILLDAFKERMEFPELKEVAFKHWTEWQPDAFIVEKKAAGAPLIQELRQMGIPVSEFTPSRGNDKVSRVNAIADIFASGRVWAPNTRWAKEVIEECATFPVGTNDDYVDCTSCALLRYRQGRFITLDSDVKDEPKKFKGGKKRGYY